MIGYAPQYWTTGQAMSDMDFSLIVPCYNEAGNVPAFFATATACFDAAGMSYELVFVDDGSTDDTAKTLQRAVEAYRDRGNGNATVRIVEFSRNFGKEAAMFAGLEHATGDVVGFIDADMQQDPAVALRMYRCLMERPDYDCVAAVQEKRRESLPLRACKRVFYRAFNDVCSTQLLEGVSDFRVFRRPVADALLSLREHYRFSKGLFAWVGFKTYVISYDVHERLSGKSKWAVRDLFSYAWNGVVSFSTWPLKLIMYIGVVLALVTLVFFGIDVYDKIAFNSDISTTQLLVYVVLLMGGVQMIVLGVFGEYLARAYMEAKNRPLYIARAERTYTPAAAQAADDGNLAAEVSAPSAWVAARSHEGEGEGGEPACEWRRAASYVVDAAHARAVSTARREAAAAKKAGDGSVAR